MTNMRLFVYIFVLRSIPGYFTRVGMSPVLGDATQTVNLYMMPTVVV